MDRTIFVNVGVIALTVSSLAYAVPDACDAFGELVGINPLETGDRVFFGSVTKDFLGRSIATGDFTGDGIADVVLGAGGSDLNGGGSGTAFLLKGPITAGAALNVNLAQAAFTGATVNAAAGWSVANAGDLNADGIDDIAIGAPSGNGVVGSSGVAYVMFGGPSLSGLYNLGTSASVTFGGAAAGDSFGDTVQGVGDVNGDGIDDFAVGAPLAEVGALTNAGKAYLFFGPLAGTYAATSANVTLGGVQANGEFGTALLGRVDTDGDGKSDVIVGSSKANAGGSFAGAAYVFLGRATFPATIATSAADSTLTGAAYNRAGWSLASAGDTDGDGRDDFWVGAPQFGSTKRGAAFLVPGGTSGLVALASVSRMRVVGENANDLAGSAIAGDIDFDNDGHADVVIGGERADGAVAGSGAAWVIHGPFAADVNPAAPGAYRVGKIGGRVDQDFTGAAVAAADLNNDGFDDAVIGAWNAQRSAGGASRQGLVSSFFGGHDVSDELAFYRDQDGDGWGTVLTSTTACTAPPGYVRWPGDCLDTDPTYYPYAPESISGPDQNCDGLIGTTDHDGDGYAAYLDCDDRTVDVSPARDELCGDHVDNDCDGQLDDATAIDALPWCPDADGDGYGADVLCTIACEDPGIFLVDVVNQGGDCNDFAATVSPDAFERCDFIDNDCDGLTDDASALDAVDFYADADGDSFGSFWDAVRACQAPSGYVTNQADCDDADAQIKPGAVEVCDYHDNDCDGITYLGGPVGRGMARLSATGSRAGDLLGGGVALLADLDGDGLAEAAVGAPNNSDLASESGALYIMRGSTQGHAFDMGTTQPDGTPWWNIRFRSNRLGSFVGSQVTSGDFNGDGVNDLLLGAYGSRTPSYQQGAFYVFFGPIADGDYTVEVDANFIVKGDAASELAGFSVAAGDVDGDGNDDVIASAPQATFGDPNMGKVFVFYGSSAMLGLEVRTAQAHAFFAGTTSGDRIGTSVDVEDINGDGFGDILIGADRYGALDNGAVYIIYGAASRFSGRITTATLLTGVGSTDRLGQSVAGAGDVNGDGYNDFVVGSVANRAYLVYGSASPLASAQINAVAAYNFSGLTGQRAGNSVAGAGDVNGDGFADFVISAHRDNDAATNAGAAYLVYGSNTWFAEVDADGDKVIALNNIESRGRAPGDTFPTYSAANRTWLEGAKLRGGTAGAQLGEFVAAGGDFNGDGYPDILLGGPNFDSSPSKTNNGEAALFVGGPYGHDNNEIVPLVEQTEYYWDWDADTFLDKAGATFTSCPMHAPISFRDELNPRLRGKPVAESTPAELVDCDDRNHTVFPGATERSGDAIDSDCDGYLDPNRLPSLSVTLAPTSLYTTTTAVANVTSSDPDGDVVTLSFQWFVDGAEQIGETTNMLAPTFFNKGQEVRVSVTANDGRGSVGPVTRSKVVLNSKPVMSACNVTPAAGSIEVSFTMIPVGVFDDDPSDTPLLTTSLRWQQRFGPIWSDIPGETSSTLASCVARFQPGSQYNCRRGSLLRGKCTPYDSFEYGIDYYSAEVPITNGEPYVTQCSLSPAAPDTTQNITVAMSALDPDADTLQLSNEWLKNSVVDPSVLGTTYPAAQTVHFDVMQARCRAYDGESYSQPVTSAPVTVINTPPGNPDIDLTPNLPRSEQDLTVSVVTAAPDIDADTINYKYFWTQNGTPYANPTYPSTTSTVSRVATVRGDTWQVTVVANDGYVDGGSDTDFVSIGNTSPTFTSAGLTPTNPTTLSDVTVFGTGWYDEDADPESYNVVWYVNGVVQPPQTPSPLVLDDSYIVRGDEIYATLQAKDPFSTGPTRTTNTITVVNAVPTTPVIAITPVPPGEDDNLNCNLTTPSTDADGDPISYTYAWYKDGVLQPALTGTSVDASLTTYAEVWYCTVTPSDGFVSGDTATSATVAIQDLNAPPAPTINSIYRYQNQTSITLTGTCISGPLQCNSITITCSNGGAPYSYSGVSCTGNTFSRVAAFDRGTTTSCSAKCYDTSLNESLASNTVTSETCNPYDLYEDGSAYGDAGATPYDEWATLPDDNTVSHTINSNIVADDTVDWYTFRTTDNPVADAAAFVNNYKFEAQISVGTDDYNMWVYRSSVAATVECPTTAPYDSYTEDVYDQGDAPHHAIPGNRNACAAQGGTNWHLYNLCENFGKTYFVRVEREFDTDCQHYQLRIYNGRP